MTPTTLPLASLHPSPFNPRGEIAPDSVAALAESIRSIGLQQPILVRPRLPVFEHGMVGSQALPEDGFEIIYGHRRYAAAQLAGLAEIAAVVQSMTDLEAATAQAVENLQREDLTPLEEARGYATLRDAHGQKPEEIAAAVGKGEATIRARLQLLKCSTKAQQALADGLIGSNTATRLATLTPAVQDEAIETITGHTVTVYGIGGAANEPMSDRRALAYIATLWRPLTKAVFDRSDTQLLPSAGACDSCIYLSLHDQTRQTEDVAQCYGPDCYDRKTEAHYTAKRKALLALGAKESKLSSWDAEQAIRTKALIDLDQVDPGIDKNRPLREVLAGAGKDALKGAEVLNTSDGGPRVTMAPKALAEALKRAGIAGKSKAIEKATAAAGKKAAADDDATGPAAKRKARDEESERAFKVRAALAKAIVREIAQAGPLPGDIHDIAAVVSTGEGLNDYCDGAVAIKAHFGVRVFMWNEADRDLAKLSAEKAGAVLVAMVACNGLDDLDDADNMHGAASRRILARYGIDLAKVEREALGIKEAAPTADPVDTAVDAGDGPFEPGARVRVKDDARGPNGKFRKRAGQVGTVEAVSDAGNHYLLRFGPRAHEVLAGVNRSELEPAPGEAATAWNPGKRASKKAKA